MTILVTGGAGYIGSHTCVTLLNSGYDIAVLDNFSNSHPKALERVSAITGRTFPVYQFDVLDRAGLETVFQECEIDAVIHFAGFKAVAESVAMPLKYYHNNISGTLVLCEVMQKYGVKNIVFSSSATVYGIPERVPLVEDMPLSAINPYGQTKLMLETIFRDVVHANPDWSVALLRYFNPVGAHESGLIGEDPNGIPNNLFPYISQVAVEKLKFLTVHGDDYPTSDGTCIRDYIHVMDLAEGHVKALEYVKERRGIEAFNLGSGKGHSVLEVIKAFAEASGVEIPYQIGPRRPGDAPVTFGDPSKAHRTLGWSTHRSLYEMCTDTWRWQSQNPGGYVEVRDVSADLK